MNTSSHGHPSHHAHGQAPGVMRAMFTVPHSKAFHRWVQAVNFWIFVSCLSLALETVEPWATEYAHIFHIVELAAVAFFTVDYVANVYFAESRIKYIFSFWGLVDLISILPSYLMLLYLWQKFQMQALIRRQFHHRQFLHQRAQRDCQHHAQLQA